MAIVKYIRDGETQLCVAKLSHDLAADVLDLLMASVMPAPLLCDCFQVVGDCTPGFLTGLQAVALQKVLRGLHDEPTTDGPSVVGALQA